MSPRCRLSLLAFVAVLAALPATSHAKKVPPHGKLIAKTKIRGGSLPDLGTAYRVTYSSQWPDGTNRPTTGVIVIPRGKAPKGGFAVVSWAHGTTGIADVCAPSRTVTDPPTDDYVRYFRLQATYWLTKRYAVAMTDYQGLGTPGMHPYLIGVSEGRSVIDIVTAAHQVDSHVGKRWAAIGHSQGGHAVLWASSLAAGYAPQLKLLGTVAVAPASHIGEQAAAIDSISGNPFGGLPALISAAAIQAAGLDPATTFSDRAYALYPQIEQQCDLNGDDSFGGIPLDEYFRAGYDKQKLIDTIQANDPEDLTIKVPLLVTQGLKDQTVFPSFTQQTVDALTGRGTKVTYRTYADSTHGSILQDARTDEDAFLVKTLGR